MTAKPGPSPETQGFPGPRGAAMKVVEAVCEILKREGVNFISCYPTNALIEAAAAAGIRPIVCRQERVGVGIADGFTRVTNGKQIGVFTMQAGPGAENAFAGIATAYSDSVPILLLPVGHERATSQVDRFFRSVRAYQPLTKSTEEITLASQVPDIMRRAFSALKMGRLGPVLVEIPADAAVEEIGAATLEYRPVKFAAAGANPRDVAEAAKVLVASKAPVIVAGQGVLYAEASGELVQLAELLEIPVTTTLEGKSAFPEDHPLSLGTGAGVMPQPVRDFLHKADVIFAVGASLTRHSIVAAPIPAGKVIIHATHDERDINKHHAADYPVIGDAKAVLRQFLEAVRDLRGREQRPAAGAIAAEINKGREQWLAHWIPKLTSNEVPINPYRVLWEFMRAFDRRNTIVTHDAGSPRNQLVPFYQAPLPRSYIGWGKSHALGTGLGLIMGAKLAAPDKFCVNFMGDAAFGMTGLDFETAVRCGIPILTIVLNNNFMAAETRHMHVSHERYGTMHIGGNYADLARSLGGWAERVEDPDQIAPALQRGKKVTDEGKPALLEFITSRETAYSRM
ncbi:MAG TPA: thiamine pyrophosphate-requiring protein [Candidatus Eisenbacteria bacterium]|nr:thiamine pyrophosphate-requiring protein [Candidatus Eisenbacteria bacterium]